MDENELAQKLDQYGEFNAQKDLLALKRQELIDAVKIPAEVVAAQDEANKRRQKVDSEYYALRKQMQDEAIAQRAAVELPALPPEYVAAYEAAQAKRAAIQEEFDRWEAAEQRAVQERKAKIDAQLTGAVREVYTQVEQRKQEINAEFAGEAQAVDKNIAALEAEIRKAGPQVGHTVKGSTWQSVYTKGRVTWNTDMLDGMIIAIPQLAKARKEGAPSIQLRKV
jgi:hypothetical protein